MTGAAERARRAPAVGAARVPAAMRSEPDWRLVLRKDLGDLTGRIGRGALTRNLIVVVVFGLLVPLRFEGAANLPAFFSIFMAFVPARIVAIDAYAGERERGSLEVLLASPLSDRGIAVGKIAAATVYGASRGWLFLATWAGSAALLRLTGLVDDAPVPEPWVAAAVAAAGLVVALAAAVFGVWQSALAPSVRAIVESGGVLRLLILFGVFFVAPWLLGLLSPDGRAPVLAVPVVGGSFSLDALWAAAGARPGQVTAIAGVLAAVGAVGLALLSADTLRRCRRESLALVTAVEPAARRRFSRLRRA